MNNRKKSAGKDHLMVKIPAWLPSVENLAIEADLEPDRLRIVIHQCFLCWLSTTNSKNTKKSHFITDGYFPIYSVILRQIATDKYAKYLALLIQHGILERKTNYEGGSNYLIGVHSQLYRWCQPDNMCGPLRFRDEKVTQYKIIKSVLRTRDRYRLEDVTVTGEKKLLPIHEALRQFVLNTTIDLKQAAAIEHNHNPTFGTDAYAELDMLHLEMICNGDAWWASIDDFGERLHTHITNLPKRFRPAMRFKDYEDTPMVCIDIRNSQPYFSSMLAVGKIFDEILLEFHPMRKLIDELARQPDYVHYRHLCESGKFNSFLGMIRGVDPAIAKVEFFPAVIYSMRKINPACAAMRNEFRRFFPGVYKFFMAVKRLTENDLPELQHIIKEAKGKYRGSNNAHKILPCMMQRAEARVMYQYIAPWMLSEGIQPFLTLHDAWYVLPHHVDQTIEIIQQVFRELGVTPPVLVIKNLSEE
jgi:hypothetical protein